MIFSDIGTPKKKDNGFDVYSEIKALLVDRGIPSKEIAFVHDANSDEKKNSLSRKVNAGEVRILLASTEKGGTGLNVQSKMKAVHHLDVPWRTRKWIFTTTLLKVRLIIIYGQLRRTNSVILSRL